MDDFLMFQQLAHSGDSMDVLLAIFTYMLFVVLFIFVKSLRRNR